MFWRTFPKHTTQIQFSADLTKDLLLTNEVNINCNYTGCGVLTCNEGVLDAEAEAFQLFVTGKLDPHETPRRCDQARVLSPTEAVNEWREPKRSVTDFDVIEAALE